VTGAILEKDPADTNPTGFFFDSNEVEAYLNMVCLYKALEVAQGAIPLFIQRDFSSHANSGLNGHPNYIPWTDQIQHRMMRVVQGQACADSFPYGPFDPDTQRALVRRQRALKVFNQYLGYCKRLYSLYRQSIEPVYGTVGRPLERRVCQGVDHDAPLNYASIVHTRFDEMDVTQDGYILNGSYWYRPVRPLPLYGRHPAVLSCTFISDSPTQHVICTSLFTNWTDQAASAAFSMVPSDYGSGLGDNPVTVNYHWVYWDANLSQWVSSVPGSVQVQDKNDPVIVLLAPGVVGDPQPATIRFDRGAINPSDLPSRESVLLVMEF